MTLKTYSRQDFLKMEDELDEFLYAKEKYGKEQFLTLLEQSGVHEPKKREFCYTLYQQDKMVQLLDTIIYHTHCKNSQFAIPDGRTLSLAEMGFLNFTNQVHNRKYDKKVIHIIMQQKSTKHE